MTDNRHIIVSTETRFRMLFLLLRLGGIPVCMKKIPKLYYLYSVTTVISMYIFYIGNFLQVYMHAGEPQKTMSACRVLSTASVVIFIHTLLSMRKCKIEALICFTESFIWEDLPIRDSETGYLTQAGLITRIKKVIKWILIILIIFHTIFSTIRATAEHETIFDVWYPFDIYSSPTYEIIYISQIFASILCVTMAVGFMLLYSSLVVITCSQLEKLRGKLSAIKWINTMSQETGLESELDNYNAKDHKKETFPDMLNLLKDSVKFHQLILQYMEMVEDTLHLVLGGFLFINLSALLLCAFSVVMNWGHFTDISQGVVGYTMLSLNVYMICSTGNELSKEAEKVRDAAWDCDWIGAPIPIQRCVMFILARSNKEFTLTAAKFVPVSMVTFMNIMQQTMSYFMFLLEMKNARNFEDNSSFKIQ